MFEIYKRPQRQLDQASAPGGVVQIVAGLIFATTGILAHYGLDRLNVLTGSIFVGLGCYQLSLVRKKRRLDSQNNFPSSTDNRQS